MKPSDFKYEALGTEIRCKFLGRECFDCVIRRHEFPGGEPVWYVYMSPICSNSFVYICSINENSELDFTRCESEKFKSVFSFIWSGVDTPGIKINIIYQS